MALIDTNILVYAARVESKFHLKAVALLRKAVDGAEVWHLAWQNVFEYIRVVTDPRSPTTSPTFIDEAVETMKQLIRTTSLQMIHPGPRHFDVFADIASHTPGIRGVHIHDARLVAIMVENGVKEIVTADMGFRKFKEIEVINPFGKE